MHLDNLNTGMIMRYALKGEVRDMKRSIEVMTIIIDELPLDHPERTRYLQQLAHAMVEYYNQTERLSDLESAIRTWKRIMVKTPGPVSVTAEESVTTPSSSSLTKA